MTEKNNIEQEIIKEFHQLAKENPFKYTTNWNSFIENPENIKNINSIKIEIDYNLNLENWNFSKLNFEFIIENNQTITFQNCSFKALKIISNPDVILQDLILHKCIFAGDVEININVGSSISLLGSKFHGKKCSINSSNHPHRISFTGTEFGILESDNKNDFELQIFGENAEILTSKDPNEWTRFFANNFILKTNLKEINLDKFLFYVKELFIEGLVEVKSDLNFKDNITCDIITLKNVKEVNKFIMEANNEVRKILFLENVNKIEVISCKNIELSGSADYITGKFENCKFKNFTGEIKANIFGETTFANCEKIKEIFADEIHKITIESSTILEEISLENCNLLKIEDSEIKNINLENCQFNDAIILNDVTFLQSPHVSNIKFSSHNVEMRNLKFVDNLSPQASGSYRALMKVCQDAGYENGVIFFHAKELETRHNFLTKEIESLELWNINNYLKKIFLKSKNYLPIILKIKNFFSKNKFTKFISNSTEYCFNILIIPLKAIGIFLIEFIKLFSAKENNKIVIESILLNFHKHFSEYGEDLFKPLKWLIQIFCSMCFWFFVLDYFFYESDVNKFYLSLKNSLGPLIFALPKEFISDNYLKNLPSSTKILCFLQTVICSSIWFVWFFMVRRRFKI